MKPGLRMMVLQGGQEGRRIDYDDPQRRRIGFGENRDGRRQTQRSEQRREGPTRNGSDETYSMRDEGYPMRDDPDMRGGMPYYPHTPVWPGMTYQSQYAGDDGRAYAHRGADHREYDQRRQEQYTRHDRRGMQPESQDSFEMTREKAIEWMQNLQNEDPAHPTGPRWTMEEVKPLAQRHGIEEGTEEFIEFWAAMNMLYSDYYTVFKEYNLTTPDAFAKMAKAFLHDKDAMDHKLGRYYTSVVRR